MLIKSHILNIAHYIGKFFPLQSIYMEKLKKKFVCKIILGKDYGKDYVTLEDAFKSLSFLTFEEIIFINKTKLMYKIANKTALTKPKLNIFKRSLSYSGALVWNNIPAETKNAETLSSFVLKCSN